MNFTQPLPLSLYVHYPWCIQKCPYCDFNSHTLGENQEQAYLAAMIRQLEQTLPSIWGRPIQSIFFGGGTPSLISEAGLDSFLSQLRALLGFSPEIEITLEANPGTVDFEKFAGFRQVGVNRLSMGIQSFDDEKLKTLGRIHSSDEAYRAVEAAKAAGFENFNLDLMFALPNQTLEEAIADVETAISLAPPHLSHYQLTLEPNTPFYKNPPVLPEEDLAWEMQLACQKILRNAGYHHYEVSAYAQPRHQCNHNLNYWQFGDYIGLGAGAHGKITDAPQGKIWRTQMPASPGGYIQMIAEGKMGKTTAVSDEDAVFEFMLNAMRLQDGVPLEYFSLRTGLPKQKISKQLEKLTEKQWVEPSEDTLKLTAEGQRFLNDVLQAFLLD
ncbi:radical SAM family heme chaperone HemW [Hydrogenovibrio marinus]|uniref:Heme chaperone HemW n=1 Tax=Hydrogenovibrio marinus TaxID=28885 RepID=A0A066ZR48_HYDMR|nr:radical SAM family heme chaperone HemW [Hydrogenovibrio marinus]KDN95987.1 coproporphyrinogen III oxidase [Hydrogenovibrio marinus]BBN58520.1 YggW family oxidoreductase [Hydrogenovibrio marinus]